ncbi:unnamed protein product [Cuscuta epithymum]|uniref:Putative plant transposon protein domain-containing protein n=1 Tax=Cuscuta epithymum TaxID=186058 RepID=A0AAV0G3B5_9ASTE|nr:unnamed protein product [Cuscuta epithymum]
MGLIPVAESSKKYPKLGKVAEADSVKLKDKFLNRSRVKILTLSFDELMSKTSDFAEFIVFQHWENLYDSKNCPAVYPKLVAEFLANLIIKENVISSRVQNTKILLDTEDLGVILGVPSSGECAYDKIEWPLDCVSQDVALQYFDPTITGSSLHVASLSPVHKLLFYFVHHNLVPRLEGRSSPSRAEVAYMYLLANKIPINLPGLMLAHLSFIISTSSRKNGIPYAPFFTKIFQSKQIPLDDFHPEEENKIMDKQGLGNLGLLIKNSKLLPKESAPFSSEQKPRPTDLLLLLPVIQWWLFLQLLTTLIF